MTPDRPTLDPTRLTFDDLPLLERIANGSAPQQDVLALLDRLVIGGVRGNALPLHHLPDLLADLSAAVSEYRAPKG